MSHSITINTSAKLFLLGNALSSYKASVILGPLGSQPVTITQPQPLAPREAPPNPQPRTPEPPITLPGQRYARKNLGRAFPPLGNSCKQTDHEQDFSQRFQKLLFNVCILVRQLRPASSFSLKKAKPLPPPANTVHISKHQNTHLSSLRSPDPLLPQNPVSIKASAIKTQAKLYSKRKQE